ncbi:MAG TPA: 3-phosphoserine/phosphohydroxythreonine transaminase [Steroidobacteraceae bacterium]
MSRVFNFSAGPAALPVEVLEQVRDELLDWRGHGASVMELSHRGKPFLGVAQQAEADLRELLAVPAGYKVLFLQGGATGQFAAIPLNLTTRDSTADYVNTGAWSKKAIGEAKKYCRVNVAADAAGHYTSIPPQSQWRLTAGASYLHYTPNETIGGVEFHWVPDTGSVPLVADFSSTILSRPIDVARFGVIYAGAQKNMGPPGLVVVIVRDDLLGQARADVPAVLDWTAMAGDGSMLNTPASFSWYVAGVVFQWVKRQGGVAAMERLNRAKSDKLYAAIDASGFYRNPVDRDCRSWMNVTFTLARPELDAAFLEGAKAAGLIGLAGHRLVGGMRASIYNAMTMAGVDALLEYMRDFQRRHG